jgi:hypothetical protein
MATKAHKIESSFINWVAHYPTTGGPVMVMDLAEGRRYAYLGVSPQRFRAFLKAQSKGTYYGRNIKGQYTCIRIHVDRKS